MEEGEETLNYTVLFYGHDKSTIKVAAGRRGEEQMHPSGQSSSSRNRHQQLIGDHVDGEPAGPRRRRRRAHRIRRGSRAPLLGGGRQPRAAGTGQLCPLQFAFPLLVLATDSSCELVVPIRLNWSCPEWAPTLTTK